MLDTQDLSNYAMGIISYIYIYNRKKFFECLACNNHHTVDYNISYRQPGQGLVKTCSGLRSWGSGSDVELGSPVDISICGNETSFLSSKERESFGLLANLLTGGAYTTHLLCLRRLRGWTWPGQTCNHSLGSRLVRWANSTVTRYTQTFRVFET